MASPRPLTRTLPAFLFLVSTLSLAAQEPDAWNVEDVHGPADTVRFETDEGTWMNLDVSRDGQWIAFDLLGDIYRVPIAGGTAQLLSGGRSFEHLPRFSPDGRTIVFVSDRSGKDNLWLMDADGGHRRQLTRLDDSFPTNPMWMPDGAYIVAKRHVRNTRSLGGGELWLFHLEGGSGVKLKDHESFTSELNEPYPSPDGRWVYYTSAGPFDYNRNVHAGIFDVSRIDRETGDVEPVTQGEAGGAIRPTVSPDGSTLAFLRRIGLETVLVLRNIATGRDRILFRGLDRDQQETWVVHGAYPTFAWTPDGSRVVITFGGKLHAITVADGAVTDIPFTAQVEQVVERAVRFPHPIADDSLRVRMVRWPVLSPDGTTLVFQAVGALWRMAYPGGTPERLTDGTAFEFAPSFSADGRWITYTTWSDSAGGHVWKVETRRGRRPVRLTTIPNQYVSPAFSPDGQWIAFVEGTGAVNRGADMGNENFLTVNVVAAEGGDVRRVLRTSNRGSGRQMPRVWWNAAGTRLLIQENRDRKTVLSSVQPDGAGLRQLATNERAEEMVPSPDGRWVAFKELHNVYVAPLPRTGRPVSLEANAGGVKVVRLSRYAGDWLTWRPDSRGLTWILGPALYQQTLAAAYDTTRADSVAADDWEHANAEIPATVTEIRLSVPRARPRGTVVLRGGRIVTMRGEEVIERADVVINGNRISRICPDTCPNLPTLARVVPVPGKTIIPGLIDVHAHMGYSNLDVTPQSMWEYYANLAYGVTTTHDPSASTQAVFAQAELVAAGRMVGPRVFSTGFILYGAENANKAVVTSRADAVGHLRRLAAVGAFSVKSYNQMRRDVRQWIIDAARDEHMLVVPEGGSLLQQNLTMILDGHTGIEHAMPVAPLRRDVLTLLARSRTGYTPTLIVGYGGIWGENYWYQHADVYANERLARFVPRGILDARARRRMMAPEEEFYHFELARSARDVVNAGGSVQLGAHGQLQGLGAHWELWMLAQGGLTPFQALRAATLAGARYLGLDRDLGSLEPGKLADLIVLNANPLEDIRQSDNIAMVMINGVLYDGDMNEMWPASTPMPALRGVR